MKITVNDKPLEEFLGQEQSKDIHQVRQSLIDKYWKSTKPRCRYTVINGHSKVKSYEDWEVFVYLCDQNSLDIADLEVEELAFVWRNWKRWSIGGCFNKLLKDIVAIHPKTMSDKVLLKELFYLVRINRK